MILSNILFLAIAGGVLVVSAAAILLHGRASIRKTQWTHVFVLSVCGAGMLTVALHGNERLRDQSNIANQQSPTRLAAKP